jgi:hypothetical protein
MAMADTFQIVVLRAKSSYSTSGWLSLSVTEQCHAIYREMRKIDAEQLTLPHCPLQKDDPYEGAAD